METYRDILIRQVDTDTLQVCLWLADLNLWHGWPFIIWSIPGFFSLIEDAYNKYLFSTYSMYRFLYIILCRAIPVIAPIGARKYSSNKYYDIWNLLMWTEPILCNTLLAAIIYMIFVFLILLLGLLLMSNLCQIVIYKR